IYDGVHIYHGDFSQTFPGPNAKHLNPALWNDPELSSAVGHEQEKYFYGPSEYLTLYPLIFLPSFRAIAQVLLVVYAVAIMGSIWLITKTMTADGRAHPAVFAQVFCVTVLFAPLLRGYIQREFETPLLLLLSASIYLFVTRRE